MDLKCEAAFYLDAVSHGNGPVFTMGCEAETSRWSGEVISDEGVSLTKGFQDEAAILDHILVQWLGN